MQRLLLAALLAALLAGAFAGIASARLADADESGRDVAPFTSVPTAPPRVDAEHPNALGFRTSAALAGDLQPDSHPKRPAGTNASNGSITVTATVLPVVFVMVDERGAVVELVTNTDARDARDVLYVIRNADGSDADPAISDSQWSQVRAALAQASAGTGTIWST